MSILDSDFDLNVNYVNYTIKYDHPIAVSDFTASLDGLNDLYYLLVNNELANESEEYDEHSRRSLSEDQSIELHINRIKEGSIDVLLSDPNFWLTGLNVFASILSIISFLRRKRDTVININQNINLFVNLESVIDAFERILRVIQSKEDKITISWPTKDGFQYVTIDYDMKNEILRGCEAIMRNTKKIKKGNRRK